MSQFFLHFNFLMNYLKEKKRNGKLKNLRAYAIFIEYIARLTLLYVQVFDIIVMFSLIKISNF